MINPYHYFIPKVITQSPLWQGLMRFFRGFSHLCEKIFLKHYVRRERATNAGYLRLRAIKWIGVPSKSKAARN